MGCTSSQGVVGGFTVGDRVFYSGPNKQAKSAGELRFGAQGQVVGQTCWGEVTVVFIDPAVKINVHPTELSARSPVIPSGYSLGEQVYYGGPHRKYPNGDQISFGDKGVIAGRACVMNGLDDDWIAVNFPGHRDAKAVRLALVTRERPVIPGGYNVGDSVFWCGMKWTFPNGDRLRFGAEGKIAGRSCVGDGLDDERVAVKFPGNKGAVAMRLPEISREPPEIPGGYRVGDRVFYAYPNWRAPDGFLLTFGVEGKLIGRSCIGDGKDDERAWVLFPGLGYGCIHLEQITRDPPVIPGGYKLGDRVYFCGPARSAGSNGDKLTFGMCGEVAGRACRSDVAVTFPGNHDSCDVKLEELSRTAPVIPGGYEIGDFVYYGGDGLHVGNRDWVTFGAQGEVVGRSCKGDGLDDERVSVSLSGNRAPVVINVCELHRDPPPRMGERLTEQLGIASRDDDVPVLASTHRSAIAAGFKKIADLAMKAAAAQVEHALLHKDLPHLSQVLSQAEDAQWEELTERAAAAVEMLVLPQVLGAAEATGDVFAQFAVQQRAKARRMTSLVERASAALHCANFGVPHTPDAGLSVMQYHKGSGSTLLRKMQDLVDGTYTGWGGYGRDTRTRDRHNERAASRIEVVSVEQVQNSDRYLAYCMRRQHIASEIASQPVRDWNVKTDRACKGLPQLSLLDPALNEHYLWHGTGPAEAKGIAMQGFNLDQAGSGRGALFGRGLYFAESCLKADEYVKPDNDGRFPLVLCRVVLGRMHYCDVEDPWELRESLRSSCRAGTGTYHSVLGDREKVRQTFREFIVFDSAQAYPEFIVWYVRK